MSYHVGMCHVNNLFKSVSSFVSKYIETKFPGYAPINTRPLSTWALNIPY